ncbi:syntenin-2 isoform X1 [Balaenoptera musculus]|uniref:Syntenin-2 isoform X1 n=1 Tax=Balaenoptera musculus TaxID=9771 RepID=A0A8B8VF38_BALMU|nr:syntenin-2 isoform X1 [Balaenoptera musculus]
MDNPPQAASIPNALTPSLREPQASRALGLMATADRYSPSVPRPRPEPYPGCPPCRGREQTPSLQFCTQTWRNWKVIWVFRSPATKSSRTCLRFQKVPVQRSRAPHRTRWWRRCPGTAWACCLGRSSLGCARSTCTRTSAARRGCGCGPSTRWSWGSGGRGGAPRRAEGEPACWTAPARPQPELPALLRAPPGFWPPRPPAGEEAARGAPSTGLFVQLVQANTPASLVGLHFGDQILQIDGRNCVGWSTGKAHRVVKKASAEKIVMVVRDRTFQRIVTMHKDSTAHVGFAIKKGKVISLVKGSSAARNGLLINHHVREVNGQNVTGLKDKEVMEILATAGNVINLAIIPTVIYEHMVRKLSPTLLHHTMDHTIPDI